MVSRATAPAIGWMRRIVNDLLRDGLVGFEANPRHRRAQLVVLTARGRAAYDAAVASYNPKAEALAARLPLADLQAAQRLMRLLCDQLAAKLDGEAER